MELTFTNEINLLDLIGLVGWAIGLFVGANWLKHRYANRLGPAQTLWNHPCTWSVLLLEA